MKPIHRLIVLSNTYRMSSDAGTQAANHKADRENRFLVEDELPAHGCRSRARQSFCICPGASIQRRAGPSIPATRGQTVHRRSLYFQTAPNRQMPFLKLFDNANPDECYARHTSVIPQQSLALMNSALAVDNARRMARQIWKKLIARGHQDDDRFFDICLRTDSLPQADEAGTCTVPRIPAGTETNLESPRSARGVRGNVESDGPLRPLTHQ